jgi:hypothetical protein
VPTNEQNKVVISTTTQSLAIGCHAGGFSQLHSFNMDDKTTEILKRFSDSWEATESFYNNLIDNYSPIAPSPKRW